MVAALGYPSTLLATASRDFAGRVVAVVGAGRTGASVACFLIAVGARVAVTDTRSVPPGLADLPESGALEGLALGKLDPELVGHAELVVVSPGVHLDNPVVREAAARGKEVLGDVELFGRYAPAPVVAITGSNGKSTVTSLVGTMLEAAGRRVAVGGNLGTPVLDLLAEGQVDAFVVEVSSFQAEALHCFWPQVAVLLNLSADHLDRYPDVDAYFEAKWRLFRNLGPSETAVLNREDPQIRAGATRLQARVNLAWFGRGKPEPGGAGIASVRGMEWLVLGGPEGLEPVVPLAEWPLMGRPNQVNAAAALATGAALGLPVPDMARALRCFSGLPHRMEVVAEIDGVRYVNDSKGTNVGAVQAALGGLQEPFIWIAGGVDKGGDFTALVPVLRNRCRRAVLMGQAAETIADAIDHEIPIVRARDMDEAMARAVEVARPGDVVVLSPGCTSFDRYTDFAARGTDFRRAVRAWRGDYAEP